jgi:hypothetical protein
MDSHDSLIHVEFTKINLLNDLMKSNFGAYSASKKKRGCCDVGDLPKYCAFF